ncbi:MAG: hypothetical protein NC548_26610 [Lachnospiraceae bacterium]|nr:hypothetical protein [Lachnospiraceae bacterium]
MKEKRKVFYSMGEEKGHYAIKKQNGFEIEVDGEKFNAYVSWERERAYIIDPKTGIALLIHDCADTELTETEIIEAASAELAENEECLKVWREWKNRESYESAVDIFIFYRVEEARKNIEMERQEHRG